MSTFSIKKKKKKQTLPRTTGNFHQSRRDKYESKLTYTSRGEEQMKQISGIINKLDYKNSLFMEV